MQISYQFLIENWPDFDEYTFEITSQHKNDLLAILHLLIELYFDNPIQNQKIIVALTKAWMEYLWCYCTKPSLKNSKIKNKKLLSIIDYLEKNYNQELDFKLIAEQFHISYAYLAKLFKDYLNISAGQYVSELRFQKALIDVATSNESITDIAYKHGFSSSSAFIKEFKKIKGISPGQYRKMLEE